jgi:hypothetical protein
MADESIQSTSIDYNGASIKSSIPESKSTGLTSSNNFRARPPNRARYLYESHFCNRTSVQPDAEDSEVSQFFGTRPNSWMRPVSSRQNYGDGSLEKAYGSLPQEEQNDCKDSQREESNSPAPYKLGARKEYLYKDHWLHAGTSTDKSRGNFLVGGCVGVGVVGGFLMPQVDCFVQVNCRKRFYLFHFKEG